jgi:hypothetical protein
MASLSGRLSNRSEHGPGGLLAASVAACLCLLAAQAPAAASTPLGRAIQTQAQSETLNPPADDAELNTFVDALVRVIGVQHRIMMMMQDEPDSLRRDQLRAGAYDQMKSAVQEGGLSVDRYNQIASALQTDGDLQGRVEAMLKQLAETSD